MQILCNDSSEIFQKSYYILNYFSKLKFVVYFNSNDD